MARATGQPEPGIAFLDLGREVQELRAELDQALAASLDSGRFVLEQQLERFEEEFARYCGARHAIGVASGTDALTLALRARGIGPGDEVITVANTCVPTVSAIVAAGARPVLADADPRTLTLDPARLDEAFSERTAAVVPVHLYGRCADMDAIGEFARRRGIAVVEDAAQAHGAASGGRRAGTLGDAAGFSFYPTKNLGALGDAGAVVTDDGELAARVRALRNHGQEDGVARLTPAANSRLDGLQASLLRAKLPHLERWTERRRELAALYRRELADCELLLPADDVPECHAQHLFVVRSASRDELRAGLATRGVGTLIHYELAIHEHAAYAHLARARGLTVSEASAHEVLSLPLYPQLTDGETLRVSGAVRDTLAELRGG